MQIDATNFVSDDWPSFEFAIKTALDSGEFCVQVIITCEQFNKLCNILILSNKN